MATYDVNFYDFDPNGAIPTGTGSTFTWNGPATPNGSATITDTETGIEEFTLDDDNNGAETATADVTINGLTSIGSHVDAELVWTIRDTVTGQVFEIIEFDVENGAAAGDYTLSEIPLVAGRSYEVLAFDSNPDVTSGSPAFNAQDYSDQIVEGTSGDDTIDASYAGDEEGDVVDGGDGTGTGGNDDLIQAGAGNDSVESGAGDDTVFGDLGSDTILGGDGNDYLQGSEQDPGGVGIGGSNTASNTFSVINLGTYADVDPTETNGVSENAADLLGTYGGLGDELYNNIQTAVTSDPNGDNVLADNDNGATPEDITIDGVTYQIDSTHVFSATVTFQDGTTGTFTAVVSQTTTGETFLMPEFSNNADNALLTSQPIVSISLDTLDNADTGLVANRVDADYETAATSSDTFGDSIEGGAGDDTLVGDRGNDTLIGGTGADVFFGGLDNDEMYLAEGDVADGGDGDDLFVLGDLGEAGASTIDITGGEGGETNGDTLQLTSDVTYADITFTNTDDTNGGLSGNFALADGTVVTFSEIENIICFTPGTRILTPQGERAIETLKPGDMVITRDSGPQPIRWLGHSTVLGRGKCAPIAVNSTVLDGARRPLLVSPQHRLLFTGYKAELLFGESEVLVAAKHLVDGIDVRIAERRLVTYFHLMLDRHEVIYAEGAATESFHANDMGVSAISDAAREEMFRTFPNLRSNLASYGDTARQCLRAHEARLLVEPRAQLAMAA